MCVDADYEEISVAAGACDGFDKGSFRGGPSFRAPVHSWIRAIDPVAGIMVHRTNNVASRNG